MGNGKQKFFLVSVSRAGEPEPVGSGCFLLLGAGAARKKTRSRSRFEKKSRAGDFMIKKTIILLVL